MRCPNCEFEGNVENARFCQRCGTVLGNADSQRRQGDREPDRARRAGARGRAVPGHPDYVPDHLVWAILATIFCCLPTGIVSIVYAARVGGALSRGDIEEARRLSNLAKTWAWVSLAIGVATLFIFLVLPILSIISSFY